MRGVLVTIAIENKHPLYWMIRVKRNYSKSNISTVKDHGYCFRSIDRVGKSISTKKVKTFFVLKPKSKSTF